MKTYFRRLAEGHENGTGSKILLPLLGVASKAYAGTVAVTRTLYEKKVIKPVRLPFPVVSVGNLTWGGTGKTPFVEYLAHKISERRRTPLVLTRGYSRDEVNQMKHHLPRAVIGVGKNRAQVARKLSKRNRIHLAILDDGLQHWPIERDIEIITVNALNPFGNGHLIPRGILREPMSVLARASIVVITHSNLISKNAMRDLKHKIKKMNPDAFIVEAYLEPLFFYRARKRNRVSLDRLRNQKVSTFTGVASPHSFQLLLSRSQIRPIRNFEFTDHHEFSKREMGEIKEISEAASCREIITTEKDYYRNPNAISRILNPLILATRLRIASGESVLTDRLFRLLGVIRQ